MYGTNRCVPTLHKAKAPPLEGLEAEFADPANAAAVSAAVPLITKLFDAAREMCRHPDEYHPPSVPTVRSVVKLLIKAGMEQARGWKPQGSPLFFCIRLSLIHI